MVWEGVSNALALQHLRTVKKGDTVVTTRFREAGGGLATVTKAAYADPKLDDERRAVGTSSPCAHAPVALSEFKTDPVLKATGTQCASRAFR